ncbi:MAG: helix-turn-helix domain-containing protein [Anaerolineales bacterium]
MLLVAPALAVRLGLRALLAEDSQIEIVGEAAWLSDLLGEPPGEVDVLVLTDVVLTASQEGEGDSLEALLPEGEPIAVLLLVAAEETLPVSQLPRLGALAWGVLPLDSSAEELQSAVRALHHGLLVGSPELIQPLMRSLMQPFAGPDEQVGERPLEALTERELQVLQLLAQGLANKQIAAALGISEHTVKFHVSGIYTKLGAASRTEAVRLGVRLGLITL